tara:strand:+ start:302 stop:481 length:180 start_codon:yes stop_codon:yes gene_type:complete
MLIQVKMFISLDIDPDEYMMPSDGDVTEEFQDAMREYIHDIDGVDIKSIRVRQEIKNEQ